MTEKSLKNLGVDHLDLQQFHVWEDAWARDERWQRAVDDLKRDGLIRAVGISCNRWEPWNALESLRTGLIDVVQVIYNIFDQAPQDELFPLCEELKVGVIARVPFDEGALTGALTKESRWPEGDWRNGYFVPENLTASVERAERLKPLVPARHVPARNGPALDSGQQDREHHHPGHAEAEPRAGQHRRQRRKAAFRLVAARAERTPLGPQADEVVAVAFRRNCRHPPRSGAPHCSRLVHSETDYLQGDKAIQSEGASRVARAVKDVCESIVQARCVERLSRGHQRHRTVGR